MERRGSQVRAVQLGAPAAVLIASGDQVVGRYEPEPLVSGRTPIRVLSARH